MGWVVVLGVILLPGLRFCLRFWGFRGGLKGLGHEGFGVLRFRVLDSGLRGLRLESWGGGGGGGRDSGCVRV